MMLSIFVLNCILPIILSQRTPENEDIIYPLDPALLKSLIVGGLDAADDQAPFQCRLVSRESACGCAIISDEWILTAAHCATYEPGMYTITTGIHDLTKPGASSHRVEEVKRHEHFKEKEKFNDIALMRVQDKFQFNDKVQPIKLATDDIPDDTTVEFTGWGRVSLNGQSSQRLLMIKLKTVDPRLCHDVWYLENIDIQRMHLCTYTKPGEGACYGDSGGPLVLHSDPPVLIGILSFGKPCAVGWPDVFARVSYFNDWIKRHIERAEDGAKL